MKPFTYYVKIIDIRRDSDGFDNAVEMAIRICQTDAFKEGYETAQKEMNDEKQNES